MSAMGMFQQSSCVLVLPRNTDRSQPIEIYGSGIGYESQGHSDRVKAIRRPHDQGIGEIMQHFHGLVPHHKSQYEAPDQRHYRTHLVAGNGLISSNSTKVN